MALIKKKKKRNVKKVVLLHNFHWQIDQKMLKKFKRQLSLSNGVNYSIRINVGYVIFLPLEFKV